LDVSPELILAGVCNNALNAGIKLAEEKTDVLFLDINMPKLSGIGSRNDKRFYFATAGRKI
jgi:DNA-binding LytR/AlgR family response regulator